MNNSNVVSLSESAFVASVIKDPTPIAVKLKDGKLWGLYRITQGFNSKSVWEIIPELTTEEIQKGEYHVS